MFTTLQTEFQPRKTTQPVPRPSTEVPRTRQQAQFSGTAPELDWATFEQYLLNPYLQQGWLNIGDERGQWAQQLGLDVGGKPTLQVGDLDWTSFNQGAMAPNLDDMGLPSYSSNPNAAADREAAYRAALANPDTIYTLGTDRIGTGGTNAGGGNTRTDVQYKRVGNKLVPVSQRDFNNGSLTQDAIKGGLLLAGSVAGLSALGGLGGAGVEGLSGMDLAADAALGSGNNIFTAGQALGGAGGLAGTGIPAYTQGAGYGDTVATLADASGASPFTAGAAAADPLAGYMTTGAVEGSTIGSALTGAGGAAGAVGAGTAAGALGTLGGVANALGGTAGLVSLGGNLLNSYLGNRAANKAADAQITASREANALAKYMYDQTRTDNMPALNARNAGLSGYQNLLQNPSSITSDPGYQFGFNQGQAAYDNSGAARGMRLSGAQAKALTKFGQDYGQTKFNESLNRYGNLAGLGQTGSGTIANAGMNYSNTAGNNITGAGNAAASGYIGSANAITGGISNFLKGWQENQLLKQLGLGG